MSKKSYIEKEFIKMFKKTNKHYLILMMRNTLVELVNEYTNASRKKMLLLRGQILPAIAVY